MHFSEIVTQLKRLERGEQFSWDAMRGLIDGLRGLAKSDAREMEGRAAGFIALADELELAARGHYARPAASLQRSAR